MKQPVLIAVVVVLLAVIGAFVWQSNQKPATLSESATAAIEAVK